ncbi:hypothetical protein [Planctomycetes bacterium K23_9]|uniref:Uncharacterized protein n=1 Tax=Stieleria marina TaxID=1930275 RepID=A0A517NPJ3_9BACT|nr:hypothetical protein K239x_09860 [Planctomycetes bacterium K23_9]
MLSSNSNDSPDDVASQANSTDQVHRGYDFETGFLSRAREWTDLLPWLRLVRTMRVAASPPLVLLVALTFAIWLAGHSNWFDPSFGPEVGDQSAMLQSSSFQAAPQSLPIASSIDRAELPIRMMIPTRVFDSIAEGFGWQTIAAIFWALFVWMPVTLLLVRQGALLTAGRPMMGIVDGLKHAVRRFPYAFVIAFVPLVCVLFIAIGIALLGWLGRIHDWIAMVAALPIALVGILCGLLAFGANVAVPLGWASLVNEKDADPLDSLSRGYEYLYRRPLHLVVACFVATVILMLIALVAGGIAMAASTITTSALELAGASTHSVTGVQFLLACFPTVVTLTLFWALVGGVYLMMRREAGGQEIEDIWVAPLPTPLPLPKLPN